MLHWHSIFGYPFSVSDKNSKTLQVVVNKNEWLLKSLSNDMEYVCMHNRLFGFPTQIYGSVCPHMEENANHLNYGLLKNARSVH